MTGIGSSESGNPLPRMVQGVAMQPILFVRSLPHVTVQLSKFGLNFVRQPVVWFALAAHGLLLILPAIDVTAVKPKEEVEIEPEKTPVLEIQSLSDLIGGESPDEELTPPEEEPPPPEENLAVLPSEEIVLTDVPNDLSPELPPEEPPDDLDEPPVDTAATRGNASSRLREAGETQPPSPIDFKISQRGCFFDASAEGASSTEAPLIFGLSDLIYRTLSDLSDVDDSKNLKQQVLDDLQAKGDSLNSLGVYSGSALYQLSDPNGSEAGFVTLTQAKGGFGWYAGIWEIYPDENNCFNWKQYFNTSG